MTLPDKLSADELKKRAKEMNRLRQAKYRARRAQDEDWKAQNRERNRIRKQRQREREKAARPKGTRRQPLRRGPRIGRSKAPKAVSDETDVNISEDASNESANTMKVTQEPHELSYKLNTEISNSRNEQQDQATNLNIEEANAAESLTILQVSVRDSTTNGTEEQRQTYTRYEETIQDSGELYEAEEDTIEDQGEEDDGQSQGSQVEQEEYIRGHGLWQNFKSMTDSYLHKVLNQK